MANLKKGCVKLLKLNTLVLAFLRKRAAYRRQQGSVSEDTPEPLTTIGRREDVAQPERLCNVNVTEFTLQLYH